MCAKSWAASSRAARQPGRTVRLLHTCCTLPTRPQRPPHSHLGRAVLQLAVARQQLAQQAGQQRRRRLQLQSRQRPQQHRSIPAAEARHTAPCRSQQLRQPRLRGWRRQARVRPQHLCTRSGQQHVSWRRRHYCLLPPRQLHAVYRHCSSRCSPEQRRVAPADPAAASARLEAHSTSCPPAAAAAWLLPMQRLPAPAGALHP